MKKKFSAIIAGFVVWQAVGLAGAASTPVVDDTGGQVLKQAQETEAYMQRQQAAQRKQEATVTSQLPATVQKTDTAHSVKFRVRSIVTNKSDIFSQQELNKLTAIPQARDMTLADLYGIANEINKAYLKKGYPASQAVIPKQDIKDGVVRMQLVEGRYGRFILKNRGSWNESYVWDQLMIKKGELVNAKKLELSLLNLVL